MKRTAAWERLRQAIDQACVARGEMQWTNGYRAGLTYSDSVEEDATLHAKEMSQLTLCAQFEALTELAMAAFRRDVQRRARRPVPKPKRRSA